MRNFITIIETVQNLSESVVDQTQLSNIISGGLDGSSPYVASITGKPGDGLINTVMKIVQGAGFPPRRIIVGPTTTMRQLCVEILAGGVIVFDVDSRHINGALGQAIRDFIEESDVKLIVVTKTGVPFDLMGRFPTFVYQPSINI